MVETRAPTRSKTLELAKRAEDAGISTLLGTDHLGRWTSFSLLQLAAEHTRLRIGMAVINNEFRHPALLAQELATLDLVTDGRLEIGLGAGWDRGEMEAVGMTFESPRRRVDRLEAAVDLLKQALRDGSLNRTADASYPAMAFDGMPKSVQRPHPPFLVGGGRRRLLGLAAREADIVAIDPRSLPEGGQDPADVLADAIDRKVAWVREAAGPRWRQLELNAVIFEVDPQWGRRAGALPARRHGIEESAMPDSPHYLVGDLSAMEEQLVAARERWGISYLTLRPADFVAAEPLVRRMTGR